MAGTRDTGPDGANAVPGVAGPAGIDTLKELAKIARGKDMAESRNVTGEVYALYKSLKRSGYFRDVFVRFGNEEVPVWQISRTCDVFPADVWDGRAYFIIEASREALEAFHDDGFVIMKIKDWLVESYRKAVSDLRQTRRRNQVHLWDYAFTRPGSPLPPDILVLPAYDAESLDGVPVVTLMLVLPR